MTKNEHMKNILEAFADKYNYNEGIEELLSIVSEDKDKSKK